MDDQDQPAKVKIVDIEMSFMSMVTFMVKAVFATIPAAIIIAIFVAAIGAFFSGVFQR